MRFVMKKLQQQLVLEKKSPPQGNGPQVMTKAKLDLYRIWTKSQGTLKKKQKKGYS